MKPLYFFISTIVISKMFSLRHHKFWNTAYIWISSKPFWKFFSKPAIIAATPNEKFIHLRSKRFLDTFLINDKTFNDNIDPVFYDKDSFTKILNNPNNHIETDWKKRIIIENTPYGNIIMLFSPYKMGFEYYSDKSSIPYSILNAISMKFCILFYCRDFFVDNSITEIQHHSKLIPIHFIEKPTNKTNNNKCFHKQNNSFAKLKNYQTDKIKNINATINNINSETKPSVEPVKNIFIYLGKTHNFSITQKININIQKSFKSPLLDNINNDSNIQHKVFDYKSFRASRNQSI